MAEAPAFLLLKWCTCDGLDEIQITSAGVAGEKPTYWLDVHVAASDYWRTRPLRTTRMTLPLPGAGPRRLALVLIEDAPDATETGYRLYQWPKPEPEPKPVTYGPAPWLGLVGWLGVAEYVRHLRRP